MLRGAHQAISKLDFLCANHRHGSFYQGESVAEIRSVHETVYLTRSTIGHHLQLGETGH